MSRVHRLVVYVKGHSTHAVYKQSYQKDDKLAQLGITEHVTRLRPSTAALCILNVMQQAGATSVQLAVPQHACNLQAVFNVSNHSTN